MELSCWLGSVAVGLFHGSIDVLMFSLASMSGSESRGICEACMKELRFGRWVSALSLVDLGIVNEVFWVQLGKGLLDIQGPCKVCLAVVLEPPLEHCESVIEEGDGASFIAAICEAKGAKFVNPVVVLV